MSWEIVDRFPVWGETGEFPIDGFFYEGGDQVNEKHLDALWNGLKELENDTRSALEEIDSDADGVVDEADYANNADTVDGFQASELAKLGVGVQAPVYNSTNDVPSSIGNGELVVINGDGLYIEDGN